MAVFFRGWKKIFWDGVFLEKEFFFDGVFFLEKKFCLMVFFLEKKIFWDGVFFLEKKFSGPRGDKFTSCGPWPDLSLTPLIQTICFCC